MALLNYASVKSSLTRYEEAFGLKIGSKKPKVASELVKIDRWLRNRLPATIAQRKPPSITHEELSDLMKWKLGRGKFRPRLQQLAESNSPESVVDASKAAFEKLGSGFGALKAALDALCVLKGIGPATASLILSLFSPDIAPFMSDEAVLALSSSAAKIDYTANRYLQYANEVKALRTKLNKQTSAASKSEALSAVDIERALWIRALVGVDEKEDVGLVVKKGVDAVKAVEADENVKSVEKSETGSNKISKVKSRVDARPKTKKRARSPLASKNESSTSTSASRVKRSRK